MPMLDSFLFIMNHSHNQLLKLVADLSDDQLTYQPAPRVNHPAWVLGHQVQVDHAFLSLITGQPTPAFLDDNWKAIYANKSEPSPDKSKYLPKSFYLEKLAAVREQIMTRLKQMTPADFQAPLPDPAR